VTLKTSAQGAEKGRPQLATGAEADTILRQISALSKRLGTELDERVSSTVLNVPIPENR
jgi:hypothetical protein